MKKIKLLKTLLIPTLGISTITPVVITATSCGGDKPTPIVSVTGVELDKSEISLEVGGSDKLTATIKPVDATDKSVSWSSNNESVASVAQDGTITAKSVGKATITVTTKDGGFTDTCQVTVTTVKSHDYVCVTANEDSTLEFASTGGNHPDLQYSFDENNWSEYSQQINISKGQTLYLKGDNPTGWSHSGYKYSILKIEGGVSLSGNIMGLLDNGKKTITKIPSDYCFDSLFYRSSGITSVSRDFLPATDLTLFCYSDMFHQCVNLSNAPQLPATTLANSCYSSMFEDCTSLTQAPDLPATTLKEACYYEMFANCASLSSVKIGYKGGVSVAPENAFSNWVTGVAASGTFYYKGRDILENFGFPLRWTINPNW